jgi:hypothetical protein
MRSEYEKIPLSPGVRFELPTRDLGDAAKLGWILAIACGMATCFLLLWTAVWLIVGIGLVLDGQMIGVLVAAISVIGFLGLSQTLKFFTLGKYLVQNKTQCHVEINSEHLLSIERLGFFNWKRKRPLAEIQGLAVESAYGSDVSGKGGGFGHDTLAIRAKTTQGNFLVSPGYQEDLILPLVVEVGEAIDECRRRIFTDISSVEVSTEVVAPPENLASKLARESSGLTNAVSELPVDVIYERPTDSVIEVYDYAGSDAYKVPPLGILKASKGMLGFSIVWNVFITVFSVIAGFAVFVSGMPNELGWLGVLGGCAFLSIFWAVGIGTALATINSGRRSAMIGVADGQLFVERKGIFGTKWVEVPLDEVEKVAVGPSGTTVNNVPIMELQISRKNGRKFGMLSQLSNEDLAWVAQELRKSLAEG